jgi:hypothetical protein
MSDRDDPIRTLREFVTFATNPGPIARASAQASLEQVERVIEALRVAHREHLRTGDYVRLGMVAQDRIREYEEPFGTTDE